MFGNTLRHVPYVRDYAEAEKQFNVRGVVRSKKWAENERPLYKTYHHYRVVKHAEYYDLMLYRTVMARFYAPTMVEGKKHERRLYMGDQSITSRDYMYHVLGLRNTHATTLPDGKRVVTPVYHRAFVYNDGVSFSADYHYVDGVLDITKSAHTKHYRRVSSKEDKAHRAKVIMMFEPYIMMAQMRMPEFHADTEVNRNYGAPFRGGSERGYQESIIDMSEGSTDQIAINHFFQMCQNAYEVLASKRAWTQPNFNMGSTYHKRPADSIDKLEKPITPQEFRTAIVGRINRLTGADARTETVEIPQFVVESDYPRTNIVFG
jgi:hypothetical protein